jgi:hypothetical protein
MREFDNVIYATSNYHQYTTPNGVHPNVLVSKDGDQWGDLYQWEPGNCGIERFAYAKNGLVYAVMEEGLNEVATMIFPEPSVRTSWGALIGPAEENLLAEASTSSFENCQQCPWIARSKVDMSIVSDSPHSGSNCLKVINRGKPGSTMEIGSPIVTGNFPAGTVVGATVRLRGWNNVKWPYVRISDRTNGWSSPSFFKRTGTNWSEFRIYWRLANDSKALSVQAGGYTAGDGDVFYVDSVSLTVNCVPMSFQMGGEPRAAEILRHNIDFPERWTDIFFWQRSCGSQWPLDGPKVFKSWSGQDNAIWLELALDQQHHINLQEVQEGAVEPLVSLVMPDFPPSALVRFAVVQDSNDIGLYVLTAEGWSYGEGRRAKVQPDTVFFGSTPHGTMQAGGLYSNSRVYDAAMTLDEITGVVDGIAKGDWVAGDLDKNGKVGLSDLAVFAGHWLDECSSPDWCQDADIDMSETVDFVDLAYFAQEWGSR